MRRGSQTDEYNEIGLLMLCLIGNAIFVIRMDFSPFFKLFLLFNYSGLPGRCQAQGFGLLGGIW